MAVESGREAEIVRCCRHKDTASTRYPVLIKAPYSLWRVTEPTDVAQGIATLVERRAADTDN
jgi:hypothetical protein